MNSAHPPFDPAIYGPDAVLMKDINGGNINVNNVSNKNISLVCSSKLVIKQLNFMNELMIEDSKKS